MSPVAPAQYLERDAGAKEARAVRVGGEVHYIIPGSPLVSQSTLASTLTDLDWYTPWQARSPIVVDQMATEITATGTATNMRIGFYRADRDWQPFGAPLADSGDISTGTIGVKTYTPSTPIAVRPGRYLSVINGNGTVTLRTYTTGTFSAFDTALGSVPFIRNWRGSRSFGAFPTPGTAWTQVTTTATPFSVIVYRLSQP